jgi:AcrR family transcriptional regulator
VVHVTGKPRDRTGARSRRSEITRKPGDERWAECLQVAARIFAQKGYAATSLQEIADALDMLKGSLYYYINSKEDLLYEVIREVLTQAEARMAAQADVQGPAVVRLERLVHEHVVFLIDHLTETTVYLHEAAQLSEARRAELPEHTFVARLENLVRDGQADGTIRSDVDVRVAALSILGSANWVYRWYSPAGDLTPEQIAGEIARMCRKSVSA